MKSFKEMMLENFESIDESAPRMIWKGGCGGPRLAVKGPYADMKSGEPVNCGAQFEYKGNTFEVMSKKYSSHLINIVSLYVDNNLSKVVISGWLNEEDAGNYSKMSFSATSYKSYHAIDRPRTYSKFPNKWKAEAELVRDAHKAIFKGKWTEED